MNIFVDNRFEISIWDRNSKDWFGDTARYWWKIATFNIPHLYLVSPLGVTPLEFRSDLWHEQT